MNDDRTLALAVIERAILDAKVTARSNEQDTARDEANKFLFAESGEWARSRHFWCQQAGIETSWLERKVKRSTLLGEELQLDVPAEEPSHAPTGE